MFILFLAGFVILLTIIVVMMLSSDTSSNSSSNSSHKSYNVDNLTVRLNEKNEWCAYDGSVFADDYTGLAPNDAGWWYISNGKVDFSFSGTANNGYGPWRVSGGKVVEPAWFQSFRDNGFSDAEIQDYKGKFESVGIKNINVIDIIDMGVGMVNVRAYVCDSQNAYIFAVFDHHNLYSIILKGLLDNSSTNTTNHDANEIQLYNADRGGVTGFYDWDNNKVTVY